MGAAQIHDAMNLGRLLSDTARRLPDRRGLIWGAQSWSWRELDARVNALVAALKARGLGKGDKLLVHARNCNQLFESQFAAFKLGAVWVPTNVRLTPPEVAYLAENSEAKALIYEAAFPEHADASGLARRIAIGQPRAGEEAYEDLIAEGRGAPAWEAEVARDDPCWFFYTSGTTGKPKAGVLTHGQMAFVVTNHIADLMPDTGPEDVSLVVAPLSHGAGAHALPQVARGACSVIPGTAGFDEAECWRLVQEHRVTNLFTVPTILTRLVRHEAVDRYDHASLKYVIYAGAPMYRADQKTALAKLGKVLVQYYGLGEVTGNITVLPPALHDLDDAAMPVGSCGYPRTGMEIAIKAPDGRRLGAGEDGEICVRGPAVFAGYHRNPEANAMALKGGWFHTGDLGRLDTAGFLYITGRASDMYISGGSNVYPREAEEVLLTHPAVAEVAVLGLPDPKWGESGVAVAVLAPGAAADEAELLGHLDGKLAKYKWPRRVFFWDELPKSGYGKIPKHLIREELYARGAVQEGKGP
ncbi:acyl-CoA synthetase [Phormidium willei BDU 130791]|nr:acyl-CoA synthetase [Phormidium willei BDU 130791]